MRNANEKFPRMTISFVLAGVSRVPAYDYKAVFEYANHLSFRGHAVTVVHAAQAVSASVAKKAFDAARQTLWNTTTEFRPQQWFRLWPAVKVLDVPSLDEKHMPAGEVMVATDWATAEAVAAYGSDKGCKFYLLQEYEPWRDPDDRVPASWKLPLQKIASARWLKEVAGEHGESAAYIPDGMDFEAFGCDVPIRKRTSPAVLMMYHESICKGFEDGIKALRRAHTALPNLKVTLFGVSSKPKGLPDWIKYVRNPGQPELRSLYNQATVFLAPSWVEGWPVPPAEAMCCGAALVCTDIAGHSEYAVHERNAFMVEPHNPQSLAEALLRIMRENTFRFVMAEQALSDIRRFTWDDATDRVETEFAWRVAGRVIQY
jgi:glycosyltransferase involved in cell wall biosynthesis